MPGRVPGIDGRSASHDLFTTTAKLPTRLRVSTKAELGRS
jgi:hypothetical protein